MTDYSQLTVNFARLLETSGHIQAAIGTLHTQLGQLETDAAPLVATWTGEAKQAYDARQAIWRRASADLTAMLQSIKRGLDESMADYQSTEKHNTELFSRG
jgi:early secretory antigenic target protein ESAT-6